MNRRPLLLLSILGVAGCISLSFCQKSNMVTSLITPSGPHPSIGMMIKDLKSEKVLISHNPEQYFMPASNQKILTAIAALNGLGEGFRFNTQLIGNLEKQDKHNLNSDLSLQFSGDPTLTTSDLIKLFQSLKNKGIHVIHGNVYLDTRIFDTTPQSAGSSIEDEHYCWNAPVDGGTIDKNCISFKIGPSTQIGTPLILKRPSKPYAITLINQTTTEKKDKKDCIIDVAPIEKDQYLIKGCLPIGSGMRPLSIANLNLHQSLINLVRYSLNKNHVVLTGEIKFTHSAEPHLQIIGVHQSEKLPVLLKHMMKNSDNLIANSLFKALAAQEFGKPGSFQNGATAVSQILKKQYQLDIPPQAIADGSGASRYNFTTPAILLNVLEKISKSKYREIFIESLPIAGVDGSLISRMKSPLLKGHIFAKTGTMTGVTALSGFTQSPKGHELIFTILVNGIVGSTQEYKNLEEKICETIRSQNI